MSRFLSTDLLQIQSVVRRFAQSEIRPRRLEAYKGKDFSREMHKRCAELGLLGLKVPEQFGGSGLGTTAGLVVLEEVAAESVGVTFPLMSTMALAPVFLGNPKAAELYLSRMLTGELMPATSWSDPAGIVNFHDQPAFATEEGDEFVLNGTKLWVSQGTRFDVLLAAGLHNDALRGFFLDKSTPGLSSTPIPTMGCDGPLGMITFDNCRVSKELTLDLSSIVHNRTINPQGAIVSLLDISAIALGAARGAFDITMDYVLERKHNGSPVASMQAIQHKLVKMKAKIEASRSILYDAARLQDEGRPDAVLGHLVKPWVTEMACDVIRDCMTLHGGAGYAEETDIAGYMRDALGLLIGDSTPEMHYSTAAFLLGLPGAQPGSI